MGMLLGCCHVVVHIRQESLGENDIPRCASLEPVLWLRLFLVHERSVDEYLAHVLVLKIGTAV